MARSNGSQPVAQLALVQVQTIKGGQGHAAAFAEVENAVKAHNKLNGKSAPHVAVAVEVLPSNTKGLAWKLALLAVVARVNGASMVRLGVHGGQVALCGTRGAVEATRKAMADASATCGTVVSTAYDPSKHGARMGYVNGFLCGMPAGLQVAGKVATTLAYGLGYLFTFPVPGDGNAYRLGQNAGSALVKIGKAASTRKPATPKVETTMPVETELDIINRQLAESEQVA